MPGKRKRVGGGGRRGAKKLKILSKSAKEIEDSIVSTLTVNWDPFTVLPKEIYLEIFNKLNDPNDKQSFMNAHPKWYNLFKRDRTLFLIENVLRALSSNGNGIDINKPLKFDSNGLRDKDYLNLRRVCRDWDDALQEYVQLHPVHFRLKRVHEEEIWDWTIGFPVSYGISETDWILRKQFGWWTAEELETDLEIFLVTHPPSRNPFLTRDIRLSDSCHRFNPDENWPAKVDKLLVTYGHHIYHLEFTFGAKVNPESLATFAKWLVLMPELKTLMIRGQDDRTNKHSGREKRAIENLEIDLPEMANLSVIKCEGLVPTAFNKLLKGFKGLDKILIGGSEQEITFQGHHLPQNLTEASIRLTFEDYNYLKTFQPFPNLRKLTLNLPCRVNVPANADWESIWKIVEETFPHLEELNLRHPKIAREKAQKQSLSGRLNLPKLKKLRVVLSSLASLDFLLNLKELEELQIVLEYTDWDSDEAHDLGCKEIIKIMDFEKMWESNIWNVFPKLRKIFIKAFARKTNSSGGSLNMYGYVKEGLEQKYMSRIPSKPPMNWGMYNLLFKSQSDI